MNGRYVLRVEIKATPILKYLCIQVGQPVAILQSLLRNYNWNIFSIICVSSFHSSLTNETIVRACKIANLVSLILFYKTTPLTRRDIAFMQLALSVKAFISLFAFIKILAACYMINSYRVYL